MKEFKPSKKYRISLKNKSTNFDEELNGVEILTSILLPYQTFIINVFADTDQIITNKVFGQDVLKLEIELIDVDSIPKEVFNVELIVVDISFDLSPIKDQNSQSTQCDRSQIQLICISTKAFSIMNNCVNQIYENTTVNEILNDLILASGGNPVIDQHGINQNLLKQAIVPPMTLYRAIRGYTQKFKKVKDFAGYLDSVFGIYKGIPIAWCSWDGNVYVKNLAYQIKKKNVIKIYQLASATNQEKTIRKTIDGKSFYTNDPIDCTFQTNAKYARIGNVSNFINKPKKKLWEKKKIQSDDVLQNYTCIDGVNREIFLSKYLKRRKTYFNTLPMNYDNDTTSGISYVAKSLADSMQLTFNLERFIEIEKITDVGSSVSFIPKTLEYTPLAGKYILKSSQIIFAKQQDWFCNAQVNLMRSNISI